MLNLICSNQQQYVELQTILDAASFVTQQEQAYILPAIVLH